MDIETTPKSILNRIIKSPSGRGYFVPSSPLRKKNPLSLRQISLENRQSKKNIVLPSKEYFTYLQRESPTSCKIIKLKPLSKERSDRHINRYYPHHIFNKEKLESIETEKILKSTQLILSNFTPKIYLPAVKYT